MSGCELDVVVLETQLARRDVGHARDRGRPPARLGVCLVQVEDEAAGEYDGDAAVRVG